MKKLLLFLLLLLILLLIYYFKCCKPTAPIVYKHRPNEFIISYCDGNTSSRQATRQFMKQKGFSLIQTCACEENLELYRDSVSLAPDGDDAKIREKPAGSDVIRNFIVTDNWSEKEQLDTIKKLSNDQIQVLFGSAHAPNLHALDSVILAVDDSGVNTGDIRLATGGVNKIPYLYKNKSGVVFCDGTTPEGVWGMNILRLSGQSTSSEPQDEDGHGTFIGNIIAGYAIPQNYISADQNINIKQLHVKFIKKRNDEGDLFTAMCGIHYAIKKGAKIINASWRVRTSNSDQEKDVRNAFCPTFKALKDSNVLLIAAAGNDTMNLDGNGKAWPAAFAKPVPNTPDFSDNIISVGSWASDSGRIAFHSNYGSFVNVYAPGLNVQSVGLDNKARVGLGTSYAAPFVARTAAILRGLHRTILAKSIKDFIIKSSSPAAGSTVPLLNVSTITANHSTQLTQ